MIKMHPSIKCTCSKLYKMRRAPNRPQPELEAGWPVKIVSFRPPPPPDLLLWILLAPLAIFSLFFATQKNLSASEFLSPPHAPAPPSDPSLSLSPLRSLSLSFATTADQFLCLFSSIFFLKDFYHIKSAASIISKYLSIYVYACVYGCVCRSEKGLCFLQVLDLWRHRLREKGKKEVRSKGKMMMMRASGGVDSALSNGVVCPKPRRVGGFFNSPSGFDAIESIRPSCFLQFRYSFLFFLIFRKKKRKKFPFFVK